MPLRQHCPDLWAAILAAPFAWWLWALLWPQAIQWGWLLDADWHDLWQMVVLAGLYPVAEELVFRGWIQGWLLERPWGRSGFGPLTLANVLASLIFSGLHLFTHPPLMALLVLFPSLIFGYARERSDGLTWPIALHCWYNLGWFAIFGIA